MLGLKPLHGDLGAGPEIAIDLQAMQRFLQLRHGVARGPEVQAHDRPATQFPIWVIALPGLSLLA